MKMERGYTLVEMLIVLAVSGLIFVAAGTVLYQMTTVSGYGNDRLSVVHEMQNAEYWFNYDAQMAVTAAGGTSLVLSFPSGRTVTYSLAGKQLQRVEGNSTMILARNITGLSFTVEPDSRLVSMEITSLISGRTDVIEQEKYQVCLRLPEHP
ncbi:MAG: prepilin-type N-terminal cleavage/methylation domain-containing protein [Dehalococcoidales bacterium]|nr:prepilin-type N-terminal cleavage/methylation domain-containing protein [Dehalococcoidales bacterium]